MIISCFGKRSNRELNTFFKNAVSTLDINENSSIINQNFQNFDDPVDRAIVKYKYHPSIILINQKMEIKINFHLNRLL